MRLTVYGEEQVIVEGEYHLNAQMDGYEIIQDTYRLKIIFPARYPKVLPKVIELDDRIPRGSDYHTYEDGSFCLGSEIKLKSILFDYPSIVDFVEKILNPFLYAVSYKMQYDIYPFGELDHGEDGLVDDYKHLFSVSEKESVLQVLRALGKRKRVANKLQCPCGCGDRIGKCDYRFKLQRWRQIESLRWFRDHLKEFTPTEPKDQGQGALDPISL
jgi:hypothetical protein